MHPALLLYRPQVKLKMFFLLPSQIGYQDEHILNRKVAAIIMIIVYSYLQSKQVLHSKGTDNSKAQCLQMKT